MGRTEEVELTNMCMVTDECGNVLVENKNHPTWNGWCFPGGHVEHGEFITPSVVREIFEETGLLIEKPTLCGIKEFHRQDDGKRYIVFLYRANRFSGELHSSEEGDVFWYPFDEFVKSDKLIRSFSDMLPIFTNEKLSEIYYGKDGTEYV